MAKSKGNTSHLTGSDDVESSGPGTKLVVAAIDFGTTYSGYAYSLKSDFERDHTKIYSNPVWSADGDGLLTLKAPTTVLFDRNGVFHSFGFKAESKYAQLAEKEQHHGWQYFRRFKMTLFQNNRIRKNMKIKDEQGKLKPALEVFSAAIGYLKDNLMETLQSRVSGILFTDVFWVLTVPAIWNDNAKQFMEEAAKMAGIAKEQLTLALEPECAAIFCKEMEVFRENGTNKSAANLKTFDPGSKFMIVDLGGGTVDITAHEVTNKSTLRELMIPSGGPWGGTVVDDAFNILIETMFTKPVVDEFRAECTSDALDLARTFETKKRNVKEEEDTVVLKPPIALVEIFDEKNEKNKINFASSLTNGQFANTIKKKRDKLLCDSVLFKELFQGARDGLLKHLRPLLAQPQLKNLEAIILVGGFSESKLMQDALSEELKPTKVILPNDAGLAVVKGAVIYGFNADSISSRMMPFTYGISAALPFDERRHPESKKVIRYGNAKCEDIFKVFVAKDAEVVPNKTVVEHTFNCPYLGANVVTVEIYKSTSVTPIFIDEKGAERVGELNLQLLSGADSKSTQVIIVSMLFGKTQLEVHAKQQGGMKGGVKAYFDFLK